MNNVIKEYDLIELTEDLVPGDNYSIVGNSSTIYRKGSKGYVVELLTNSNNEVSGAIIELDSKEYKNNVIGVGLSQIKNSN